MPDSRHPAGDSDHDHNAGIRGKCELGLSGLRCSPGFPDAPEPHVPAETKGTSLMVETGTSSITIYVSGAARKLLVLDDLGQFKEYVSRKGSER